MLENGFPCEEDAHKASTLVFDFPVKAPDTGITVEQVGAMEQLRLWKIYQDNWCEHKPSITVYYTENEFLDIGNWLWNNFDEVSGISFLPVEEHTYQQAPYERISENEYNALCKSMPVVDWDNVVLNEQEDNTVGSQTMACTGAVCEMVDID
jgi:ribonucleoside-diphosphate reductase alpha chain